MPHDPPRLDIAAVEDWPDWLRKYADMLDQLLGNAIVGPWLRDIINGLLSRLPGGGPQEDDSEEFARFARSATKAMPREADIPDAVHAEARALLGGGSFMAFLKLLPSIMAFVRMLPELADLFKGWGGGTSDPAG